MPFRIIREDITRVHADAIVNTANPCPIIGGGTDRAIYESAGALKLLEERQRIGEISVGEVAATPAYGLFAEFILHTVGPAWWGGTRGEYEALASCYRKSLLLAEQLRCKSIAFPLISTGTYGFPKDRALAVAIQEISKFLETSEMDVTLVVFGREAYELSSTLVQDVEKYIDDRYVAVKSEAEYGPEGLGEASAKRSPKKVRRAFLGRDSLERAPMASAARKRSLSEIMEQVGESFQTRLFRLIDERGLTDVEVYKRANIDRKLFSKIRCNPDYAPKKRTAVAFAIALELNLDETVDLLRRAGFAFSPSSKFDLIVAYCIENRNYNIIEINTLLFRYDQPLLGC